MTRQSVHSLAFAILSAFVAPVCAAQTPDELTQQRAGYDVVVAKGILDLQPFRATTTVVDSATGRQVKLVSLNPAVNAWFLLQIETTKAGIFDSFHLENPRPERQGVRLENAAEPVLIFDDGGAGCALLSDGGELLRARKSGLPYAPVCGGHLYLRNRVSGSRTNLEAMAEFVRDNVWGGENIVRIVRDTLFSDAQLEPSDRVGTSEQVSAAAGPAPMKVSGKFAAYPAITTLFDIGLTGAGPGRMALGLWYPVTRRDGVFASAFQPQAAGEGAGRVDALDAVERKATGYMVAFDLGLHDLGFALGTDHPSLGWSGRPPASIRPSGLPGPDGVGKATPLVKLGMVNPALAARTVATFTGGFKRHHGAFKYSDKATSNYGHHYGFIENGVIFSKLQPGLSTLLVLIDGTVRMKTWTREDDALLPHIRFARQNGVPLIEDGMPGAHVMQWGAGNWSGSANAKLRTLRAGACIARTDDTTYLLYGYFSTATPSAMAKVFQGYGCDYAMLLDMNALEHTYLAVYTRGEGAMEVGHIVPGMGLIDKKARDGTLIPRFLGYADNRDFFYLTRKGVIR